MGYSKKSRVRRFLKRESGQTAAVVAVTIFAILALSATGIETGHVYYAYRLLQASTNAATLAAAQAMPDIGTSSDSMTAGTAWGNLKHYSSIPNALNTTNMLTGGTITANFTCSSTVSTSLSVACQSPTGSGSACSGSYSTCNEVAVTQHANVSLWFGGIVGMQTMSLSATAAMRGGTNIPYNIAVIVDATASMASCGTGSKGQNLCLADCPNGASSQIACAVQGLQVMLESMDPCALNTTCSSTSSYVDSISLFVFPAIEETASKNYTSDETACPSSNPPIVPYGFEDLASNGTSSSNNLAEPLVSTTTSSANTYFVTSGKNSVAAGGTYQVVSWDNTYKTSDMTKTLNLSDLLGLPIAVGAGSCQGLQAPGGEGTYYAQVINAAQAALAAQQASNPGSQNVLIILSDGDANACNTQAYSADDGNTTCSHGSELVALNCPSVSMVGKVATCGSTSISQNGSSVTLNCPSGGCSGIPLNGTGTSTTNPNGYNIATFPSALGECGQAVQAAQNATAAGTMVYTVAMGSETSGGCSTDQKVTITNLTNGAVTWPTGGKTPGQPCNAIGAMATNANTFYSDDTNGCAATNNAAFTTMTSIFTAIGNGLTAARLVPNGTT